MDKRLVKIEERECWDKVKRTNGCGFEINNN